METPTPARMKSIPVWAQTYIKYLEQRVTESAKTVAELRDGPADSNVLIRHHGGPDHRLGKNTIVSFNLGEPVELGSVTHQDRLAVSHDGTHGPGTTLVVRSNGGALHLIPTSSNTVRIRIGTF